MYRIKLLSYHLKLRVTAYRTSTTVIIVSCILLARLLANIYS